MYTSKTHLEATEGDRDGARAGNRRRLDPRQVQSRRGADGLVTYLRGGINRMAGMKERKAPKGVRFSDLRVNNLGPNLRTARNI